MSAENSNQHFDRPKSECTVPPHPFFELTGEHASFVECMDALDSVNSMIELFGFLKLESGEESGLTPKAAFGYHSILVLTQGALSYVTNRLIRLQRLQQEKYESATTHQWALLRSLPELDDSTKDQFLNSVAAQMDIARSELNQLIETTTG